MKILVRIALCLIALVVIVGLVAYVDGTTMPVNHSVTVSVPATPGKVFNRIVTYASASTWRPEVKSVTVLPPDNGRDHWIEDLGHGVRMNFLATETSPVAPDGHAVRKVMLEDSSYGGTWTYLIAPGPEPGTTALRITEDGYINPPVYRFMMAHVFGPTRNLDVYMTHLQAVAPSL